MGELWSDWTSLGRPTEQEIGGLAVGHNADGRQELFAGARGGIQHIWQTAPNGGWSHWQRLDDAVWTGYGNLAVATNQDGRLEVFTLSGRLDQDPSEPDALLTIWQLAPGGGWRNWASLGLPTRHGLFDHRHTSQRIAVGQNQDGRLEIFALHWNTKFTAGDIWHIWQTVPNNGWSHWQDVGRPPAPGLSPHHQPTRVVVGQNLDGRLELFMMSNDPSLWHIWQTLPNDGWSEWRNASGDARFSWDDLAVAGNCDGRLELFAIDGNNTSVHHAWQTAPNNDWSEWESLGAPPEPFRDINHLSVAQDATGHLGVFVLARSQSTGNEGDFWHTWRRNGDWSHWRNLGHPADHFGSIIRADHPSVAIGHNASGGVELFVTAQGRSGPSSQNDEVWHIRQL